MTDPTHVYLNLDVVNNSTTTANPLIFNETRNMPFLSSSDNYFCSVVRFTLQTSNSLPVFIPDIRVGQNDVNQTVYGITLSLSVATSIPATTKTRSAYVSYESFDTTQATPSTPTTQLGNASPYYYIYNVNDWVDIINSAFINLTTQLRGEFTGETPAPAFRPPFVSYDISTGLFTINKDNSVDFVGSGGTYSLDIYFNARLYNILPFSSRLMAAPADLAYNTTYKLNIFNKSHANITTLYAGSGDPIRYISLQTEFSPLPMMNPVRSIFFKSLTLPIQPTLTQPPKAYTDITISDSGGLPAISNILTDFEVPVSAQNNYSGELIYQPQAEYRFLDMNSSFNLNKIDLQAGWTDKYGNAFPLYLQTGCCASLKLLFRHKRFNLSYNY